MTQRTVAERILEILLRNRDTLLTSKSLSAAIHADPRRISDTLSVFEAFKLISFEKKEFELLANEEIEDHYSELVTGQKKLIDNHSGTISSVAIEVFNACARKNEPISILRKLLNNNRRIYDAINVLRAIGIVNNDSSEEIFISKTLFWIPYSKTLEALEMEALRSLNFTPTTRQIARQYGLSSTPCETQDALELPLFPVPE